MQIVENNKSCQSFMTSAYFSHLTLKNFGCLYKVYSVLQLFPSFSCKTKRLGRLRKQKCGLLVLSWNCRWWGCRGTFGKKPGRSASDGPLLKSVARRKEEDVYPVSRDMKKYLAKNNDFNSLKENPAIPSLGKGFAGFLFS